MSRPKGRALVFLSLTLVATHRRILSFSLFLLIRKWNIFVMSIFFTFDFPRDFDHRYDNVRWRGERFVKKNVVFKFISKDCFRWYYFASDLILWKRNESKPLMWMYLFSHPESASGSRVVDLKEGPSNLGFWSFSIRFGEENFDVKSVKPGVFISYIRVGCEHVLFLEREWTLKYLLLQNSLSQFLRIEGTILSIISLTLNINFHPNYIIPFLIYILCLKFLKKLRNKRIEYIENISC